MHRMVAWTLLVLAGAPSPAGAQSPFGAGGGRGGTGEAPRVSPAAEPLPSPEDLAGPAVPEFVVDRFELDTAEAGAYRVVYDSFMTATRALRDSATAFRQRVVGIWQSGNREAARGQFPALRRLGEALNKEDERFDDRLKQVFSKPHYKEYKEWRSEQRKQAEEDRRERMKQLTGSSPGR